MPLGPTLVTNYIPHASNFRNSCLYVWLTFTIHGKKEWDHSYKTDLGEKFVHVFIYRFKNLGKLATIYNQMYVSLKIDI